MLYTILHVPSKRSKKNSVSKFHCVENFDVEEAKLKYIYIYIYHLSPSIQSKLASIDRRLNPKSLKGENV